MIINEWLASLEGYADSTVKMWFDCVNAAGRYVKKAYKVENPCSEAERPKVSRKRRRYFSTDEMVAIIKACVNEFELALVMTLIDSACRIGELVKLKGGDVGDGFINVVGKTGERRYRLDVRLCERLRVLAGGDEEPVFKNRSGGFYRSGDGLGHRVRYIAERAGIKGEKIGVHTIRHSSASLVARESMKPLIVKALLQHDDVNTSMVYIHDVEDLVVGSDEYSPLKLVEKRYRESHKSEVQGKQLGLEDGEAARQSVALAPVGSDVEGVVEADAVVDDMFPEVPEGVAVRTLLRYKDLILLRRVCRWYASYGPGNNDVARLRELMKRMLRKGGSGYYSRAKEKGG